MTKTIQIRFKVDVTVDSCCYIEFCKKEEGHYFYVNINKPIPDILSFNQVQNNTITGIVCNTDSNMCPCKDTHFLNIEVDSIKIIDISQTNILQTNNMNSYYNINNNISNNIYIEPNYDSGEYNWSFNQNNMNYLINYINANYTIAVDTHVFRVSNRLGIVKEKDVLKTELALLKAIPKKWQQHAHHWLILHGRYVCIARKPKCETCLISDYCEKNFS